MPVLRVRRLAVTLLQARYTMNRDDERSGIDTLAPRQDFRSWVRDQILMLYGTYNLAAKTIAEFAYGLRHARWRRTHEEHGREPEPVMHFFWRAAQLGVPRDQIVGSVDQAWDLRYGTTRGPPSSDLSYPHPKSPYICGGYDGRAGGATRPSQELRTHTCTDSARRRGPRFSALSDHTFTG